MAVYHLTLKVSPKGKAAPHFHYICATAKYTAKRGVVHIQHGNMPLWAAAEPSLFWQASDNFERANGTVYRELEVSLPRELPLIQQIELAKQLAEEACGNNHAFSFAIHHSKASDGGLNPHVHLQFSERIDDGIERDLQHYFKRANRKEPEKGGCVKDRSWQAIKRGKQKVAESSVRLVEVRQSWERMCNQALADYGHAARIDHRSNEKREIETAPQPKVGAKSWNLFHRTGETNERYRRWKQVIASNNAIITKVASKPSAQGRYHDAMEELQTEHRHLAALQPVRRPDKASIIRSIANNKKHVRRLNKEIWKLEHVASHKAYNEMKQAEWKRDTGNNIFMRAWNRFYYGGDYNRLKGEYDDVLQSVHEKIKQRDKLIQNLCQTPDLISRAKIEFSQQSDAYRTYHQLKTELEQTMKPTEREVNIYMNRNCQHVQHSISTLRASDNVMEQLESPKHTL